MIIIPHPLHHIDGIELTMPDYCCTVGCKNLRTKGSKIFFFRVPADPKKRERSGLLRFTGRTGLSHRHSRLCGAHFVTGRFVCHCTGMLLIILWLNILAVCSLLLSVFQPCCSLFVFTHPLPGRSSNDPGQDTQICSFNFLL